MQTFAQNPGSTPGLVTLLDDEGTTWTLHRKHLDLRTVRRLVRTLETALVWGRMGGLAPEATTDDRRPELWELIKRGYGGPGGDPDHGRYTAHEFRSDSGRRMVYVEDHC
ncbi:hypothetical protein [Streptomyces rubellomurinus]|uniref:Uncharacterized protein n=2 Tax=Streptomyces TaxID=1883 RepID=A0A0F2TH01_STRR3|nr:hypothetical protein [Streptomyces rubellomurinus]KJS62439.1 hypothetical protein VM95_08575 [Streptomyces rubellomurinus]